MKKKAIFMLGIAGSIGVSSCNETNVQQAAVPISGAGRVVSVDSANDCVIVDTTARAVTRNERTRPQVQISGLRTKNVFPKTGDVLFFTINPEASINEKKKLESFRLFSYHMN